MRPAANDSHAPLPGSASSSRVTTSALEAGMDLGRRSDLAASAFVPSDRRMDQVRLSLRMMRHLAVMGRPTGDGHAQLESTQKGIAVSLGVTQGAVSKVLRRLLAADVVLRERRRVHGLTRRVRAYYLTRRGEELAKELSSFQGLAESPRAESSPPD